MTKTTKRKTKWDHVTKDAIVQARDDEGLSWRDVAAKLKLGSPSTARAAYTALAGRHHSESQMTGKRAPRRRDALEERKAPIMDVQWTEDTPVEEIEAALNGRTLLVQRSRYGNSLTEEIQVHRLMHTTIEGEEDELVLTFSERQYTHVRGVRMPMGSQVRSIAVSTIRSIR